MNASAKILLVALAAGTLGALASLLTTGPGPLLRTEPGQRALNAMLSMSAPRPPSGVAIAQRGRTIQAMTLPDLDGHPIALPAAYAGHRLLINLWASWCGPCAGEMPGLQHYSAQQTANGVQVVGIALDDAAEVRAFLQRVPVSYPILIDAPGPADAGVRLGNFHGVLPYSILVAADGRMLKQKIGPFADGEIAAWVGE